MGLLLGAAAVFVALGALGSAVSGRAVVIAAVALGVVAVASDALGLRVRPQIRFQVPEPWRRTMPLPRALFLYGLLLGTGLTTYVPATAAWALPALSLALGDVKASLAIAVGFAAGRALPVLLLRENTIAERPRGLRLVRVLAAASLLAALVAGQVQAAGTVASPGGDPSVEGAEVAWQQPGVGGFLRKDGTTAQLPGNDPAIGATFVAWHTGSALTVADRATLAPIVQDDVPGVQKLAVSRSWLAYRTPTEIHVRPVTEPGPGKTVEKVRQPGTLGRPALGVEPRRLPPRDRRRQLDHGRERPLGKAPAPALLAHAELLNPSLLAGQLLYVRTSRCSQQLVLGPLRGGRDKRPLRARAARRPGRRARAPPHEPGRAPAVPAQAARHGKDALDDRALADDRLRDRAPAVPRRPHRSDPARSLARIGDNGCVGIISRGFHGRRQDGPPDRVPPGQYLTDDFPVLSAGPTPHTTLEEWTFDIRGGAEPVRWTWEELQALPSEEVTKDIHCVTKWSKLDTVWQGVSVDTLLEAVEHDSEYALAFCDGGYTTNLPIEDLTDGKAWVAYQYDGEPLEPEHGGPARLLVPHLYFWKSAKWVRGLALRDEDEPGFWEQNGYHLHGDPWLEQRYWGD